MNHFADQTTIDKLRRIQMRADAIRLKSGISNPRSVLFRSPLDGFSEDQVVVEADGFGASILQVIEGNFPIDFFVHVELMFGSEDEGVRRAQELVDGSPDAYDKLLEYSRRNSS